jgi:hypothetical protein
MVLGYESEATGQSLCVGHVKLVGSSFSGPIRGASHWALRRTEWIFASAGQPSRCGHTSRLFQCESFRSCGVLVCELGLKRGEDR